MRTRGYMIWGRVTNNEINNVNTEDFYTSKTS